MTVTTTTSQVETVKSEVIDDLVILYQFDETNFLPFARFKNMSGEMSNVATFPAWEKDSTTDIANETTSLTATEFTATETQVTMARVGIARELSENILEDTILGRARFLNEVVMDAARLLGEAAETDFAAEFANAGNNVTDSGNPCEISDLVTAMGKQRANKVRGPHVYCLDDAQLEDIQLEQSSDTATPWQTFYQPNADGSAFGGFIMGSPVFASGVNATANTGTNAVGCLFADGQSVPRQGAFAYAVKRTARVKTDEDVLKDTHILSAISRYGVGTVASNKATKIVTSAT